MQQTFVLQVRNPEKVDPQKNLTIVKCDVFSAQVIRENNEILINWFHIQPLQSLEDLFCGQDAVVSTLGFPKTKEVFKTEQR